MSMVTMVHKLAWFRSVIPVVVTLALMGCSSPSSDAADAVSPATSSSSKTPSPVPERVQWQKTSFYSKSLGKKMDVNIYLPPNYSADKRYPVLYLLHGFGGTSSDWLPYSGLPDVADRMIMDEEIDALIVVSPQIDNSFGINSSSAPASVNGIGLNEGRYEDYIVNDVRQYVEQNYPADPSAESRFIGGISMGGFAALHIAFRHPDLYGKVGGHSPALWFEESTEYRDQKEWVLGDRETKKHRDPMELALSENLNNLSVYLDCGGSDFFAPRAIKLYQLLASRNVQAELHIPRGGHDPGYWMSHVGDYLKFYAG
ncbi:alpha/beta hydrolase family protein [Cohnella sp. CFH 77786]|uniref:alpha/beta hydrolase n=1 Tax=Cohnella sp. CFH 77786 TaxID=2662265 RepID=UPI001C610F46|nr:alpha/beta hydrolase-fold protein [Cohnella sp. CFH 77786]